MGGVECDQFGDVALGKRILRKFVALLTIKSCVDVRPATQDQSINTA
jgi:hypothetical protein